MKLKKLTAILLAAAITSTAGSSLVFAESYSETEKVKIASLASTIAKVFKAAEDAAISDAYVDTCLELGDTGRALAGMMVPFDISWANNIGFNYCISIVDGVEAVVGDFYLNNTAVCSLEYYLDTNTMQGYFYIPELHEAYLSIDLSEGFTDETSSTLKNLMNNPMALYPESTVMEELINRYGEILADGFGESISGEDSISIEGVSMDCNSLEGQMQSEDAQNFLTTLLSTAKDDAQLKEIIEQWAPFMELEGVSTDIYQDFQTSIDDVLADLAENPMTNDGSYVSSKLWLDTEGTIVGRQISVCDGAESMPFLTYKAPKAGADKGFYLEIGADDEYFAISGKGTVTDGKLNGTYDFMLDDVVMASVEIIDADEEAAEDGSAHGSYKFILQPGIGEEEYQTLSSFALTADIENIGATSESCITLGITMSDADLVSLRINSGLASPMELPDFAALTNVLDLASEDDLNTFIDEMDWSPILENCLSAGASEEAVAMVDELLSSSLYGTAEDVYDDDFAAYETEPAA